MSAHPAMRPTLLMSVKMVFHFVPVGNTISTTFSPDAKIIGFWDIASANDTMTVDKIADAWGVASLGFFVP